MCVCHELLHAPRFLYDPLFNGCSFLLCVVLMLLFFRMSARGVFAFSIWSFGGVGGVLVFDVVVIVNLVAVIFFYYCSCR